MGLFSNDTSFCNYLRYALKCVLLKWPLSITFTKELSQ